MAVIGSAGSAGSPYDFIMAGGVSSAGSQGAFGGSGSGGGTAKKSGTSKNKKSGTSNNPYYDIYKQSAKKIKKNYNTQLSSAQASRNAYLANQAQMREAYRQGQLDTYNANKARAATENTSSINKTNEQYDASAKQNYINYMQAQKNLASQLNSLGVRGGASESSAIRLNTNYGSNVAANEAARGTAVAGLREAYEKALFDLDQSYAQALRDYDTDYNQRIASYEDTYNTRVADIAANRTNALNTAYMTAKENDLKYKMERREADLANFEKTIVGRYKKKESYKKLIQRLKKSKDPNRKAKIRLAQQAMNQLEEGGSSGGGGGGGRSYGGGGGYGGYSNDSTTSTYEPTRGGSLTSGGTTAYVNRDTGSTNRTSSKTTSRKSSRASSRTSSGRNRRSISRGNGLIY